MSPRGPFHIGALEGIARRLSWKVKLPSPDHRLEFKLLPGIQEVPNESHLEAILGHYRQWNELERGAKEIEKTAASNLEGVIHQAFHEMVERHKEQQREGSGEPYSVHPMHLAFWAAQSGMSWRAIVAALLHDVVEDTGVSLNYIKQTYGQDVAYLVYKLSKPKYRNGQLVFAWHPDYQEKQTDDDNLLKEEKADELVEAYRDHLFKGENHDPSLEPEPVRNFLNKRGYNPHYLNDLDLEAILLKGLDIVHNENTREGLAKKKQDRLTQKNLKLQLVHFMEALHPAFLNAIPEPHQSTYRKNLVYPSSYPFLTGLAGLYMQNGDTLRKLPPTTAPTINYHVGMDARGKREIHALFGHETFGSPDPHSEPFHQIYLNLLPLHYLGADIAFAKSRLPAGFQGKSFEAFRIAPGNVPSRLIQRYLRLIYLTHARKPFESDAHDFKTADLFGVFHPRMTLKGGHVRSELSVFLPHDSFRKIAPDPHESDLLEWYSKEHLRRFRLEDLQEKINRFLEENKEFPFRDIAVFRDVPRDAPFVRLDLVIPPNLRENKNRASLESHLAVLSKYLKGLTLST